MQIDSVLDRYERVLGSVQDESRRVDPCQRIAAHVTAAVENLPERVDPRGPRVRHVPFVVYIELREFPRFGPAADVARRLIQFQISLRNVSVAAPHHHLVDPIYGSGCCDQRGTSTVAPAQHRILVDS